MIYELYMSWPRELAIYELSFFKINMNRGNS